MEDERVESPECSSTAYGKEEAVPVNPSNVIVTKLYEGDPERIKSIIDRSGGASE